MMASAETGTAIDSSSMAAKIAPPSKGVISNQIIVADNQPIIKDSKPTPIAQPNSDRIVLGYDEYFATA
jgi:hypothetical protein